MRDVGEGREVSGGGLRPAGIYQDPEIAKYIPTRLRALKAKRLLCSVSYSLLFLFFSKMSTLFRSVVKLLVPLHSSDLLPHIWSAKGGFGAAALRAKPPEQEKTLAVNMPPTPKSRYFLFGVAFAWANLTKGAGGVTDFRMPNSSNCSVPQGIEDAEALLPRSDFGMSDYLEQTIGAGATHPISVYGGPEIQGIVENLEKGAEIHCKYRPIVSADSKPEDCKFKLDFADIASWSLQENSSEWEVNRFLVSAALQSAVLMHKVWDENGGFENLILRETRIVKQNLIETFKTIHPDKLVGVLPAILLNGTGSTPLFPKREFALEFRKSNNFIASSDSINAEVADGNIHRCEEGKLCVFPIRTWHMGMNGRRLQMLLFAQEIRVSAMKIVSKNALDFEMKIGKLFEKRDVESDESVHPRYDSFEALNEPAIRRALRNYQDEDTFDRRTHFDLYRATENTNIGSKNFIRDGIVALSRPDSVGERIMKYYEMVAY